MQLIDNWEMEIHRLWSIRVGLFFFILNGAVLGLAALVDTLNACSSSPRTCSAMAY
jgi:hypothetical protein